MKKPAKSKDVRLLPAVMGVAAMLLVLKAGGMAFTAQAQPAPAAAAPAAAAKPATAKPAAPAPNAAPGDPTAAISAALSIPKVDPTATDQATKTPDATSAALAEAGVTPAQMDVLTSLSDRRDALDQRQRQLDLQANMLTAAEKRVDGKIVELKALQDKIEALLDQRDSQDAAQLNSLVKIYTAMKPKDAARIFDKLDDNVRLSVAGRLKPDVAAAILAQLPADVAQKLTVQLADRYHLADADAAGAQAAASTPANPAAPAAPKNGTNGG